MTLTVSRDVPGHVGMLSTGVHGQHAISTGKVAVLREELYTAVYSPEQTKYVVLARTVNKMTSLKKSKTKKTKFFFCFRKNATVIIRKDHVHISEITSCTKNVGHPKY